MSEAVAELDSLYIPSKTRRESDLFYRASKRVIDVLLSAAILVFTAPLMIFIALYVFYQCRCGVIFRQVRIKKNRRRADGRYATKFFKDPRSGEMRKDRRAEEDVYGEFGEDRRTGRGSGEGYYGCAETGDFRRDRRNGDAYGEPFIFFKFRTMFPDARKRYPDLYGYSFRRDEIQKLKFKIPDDPRIPDWARWLRKSSFDELPNFWNVLKGDMTLVGPRPDIPEMVRYYTPEQRRLKLSVKPGVTGLAQIEGRGELTFQETLEYDIRYVRNRSLRLDLDILLRTFLAVFHKRVGAY